ncbi:uncharacterized protein RAG0_16187 [Rhynchosporium agropyri]|uniref:Wax synthase domain-containing protein n=1 Tax=Rhynchosporium agropyri TaxID=914238 RepID=A0A1E1LR57_9HELO|nr:uncharacterized protein RAG0_16187 [Rhynchosporium agropyri]
MATQVSAGLVALQLTLMILVLGFTAPNSVFRPAGLPLISVCTYLELPFVRKISNNLLRAFVGAAGVYVNILYIDTVLLHKWSFENKGPASALGGLEPVPKSRRRQKSNAHNPHESNAERLLFGAEISLQSRFPTTKWPIKNIPPFRTQDPAYKPTKSEFLQGSLIKLALYVFLLDLTSLAPKSDNAVNFGDSRIPFFSRASIITRDELITRIAGILGYWTVQYIIIQAIYASFAIVAVTFDITAAASWPPVFGSVSDSYSIRRFWGTFYHQLIRRGCGSIAHFITYSTLDLTRGSLTGRYLFIFCTFAVSGIFHTFSDLTQGISLLESGAMRFFVMQTLGIMMEDGAMAVLNYQVVRESGSRRGVGKILGYLWVVCWLVWSTPVWTFKVIQKETKPILPFSLIAFLVGW